MVHIVNGKAEAERCQCVPGQPGHVISERARLHRHTLTWGEGQKRRRGERENRKDRALDTTVHAHPQCSPYHLIGRDKKTGDQSQSRLHSKSDTSLNYMRAHVKN